jgi:hypothetical protein
MVGPKMVFCNRENKHSFIGDAISKQRSVILQERLHVGQGRWADTPQSRKCWIFLLDLLLNF